MIHGEPTKIEVFKEGVNLASVSARRNGTEAVTGVAFLLSRRMTQSPSSNSTTVKMLSISSHRNPRITTITAYSPTNTALFKEAEDYQCHLRIAMNDVPAWTIHKI